MEYADAANLIADLGVVGRLLESLVRAGARPFPRGNFEARNSAYLRVLRI